MDDEIRIVVLGKTGAGKSSVANTVFKAKVFEVYSALSGTAKCECYTKEVNGKHLKWIDTPGFFDTGRPEKEMKLEIVNCIKESAPGPHVFLIILKVEQFIEQEQQIIQKINNYFTEQVFKFAIVLFTNGDNLDEGQTIKDFVDQSEGLRTLLANCGDRCHVVDNKYWKNNPDDKYRNNQYQVSELLKTIDKMKEANGGHYTNDLLQQGIHKIMALAYSCTAGALMVAFLGRAILEGSL